MDLHLTQSFAVRVARSPSTTASRPTIGGTGLVGAQQRWTTMAAELNATAKKLANDMTFANTKAM